MPTLVISAWIVHSVCTQRTTDSGIFLYEAVVKLLIGLRPVLGSEYLSGCRKMPQAKMGALFSQEDYTQK